MTTTKPKRRRAPNLAAHTNLLAFMKTCLRRRENGDHGSVNALRALLNRGKTSVCRYRLPDDLRARYGKNYLVLTGNEKAADCWKFDG